MASVIITGASGLLGRAIYKEFVSSDTGYKVIGLCHSRVREGLIQCDLTNKSEVTKLFNDHEPDVIVHSAAERKPDVVEKDAARTQKLNVSATEYLLDEIVRRRAECGFSCYLLYISTDYVFDGTSPPYAVHDKPNPLNKYGLSKLEGERCVLDSNDKYGTSHGILRVPILYGDVEHISESAVTILLNLLLNQDATSETLVDDYQRRYPTYINDVATVCRQLAQLYTQNASTSSTCSAGIFHWSSTEESITKYDMVSQMSRIFGLSMEHVKPDKGPPKQGATPRPYDVKLDISRLQSLGFGVQTCFMDGIKSCLERFVNQ